jgi:hypothetical protein
MDRGRFACQDQESALEGVLSVRLVGQQGAAHPQHHRAMAAQQRVEAIFVTVGAEPMQQVRVAKPLGALAFDYTAEQAQDRIGGCVGHSFPFGAIRGCS